MERECPFCGVEEKAPWSVVYRNRHALVILDKHPFVEGHLLAIPKRHVASVGDLSPAERAALLNASVNAQTVLIELGYGKGVDWRVNYRPFLAESEYTVRHCHMHIIPRRLDDALYRLIFKSQHYLRTTPRADELAKKGEQFRKAFAALKK